MTLASKKFERKIVILDTNALVFSIRDKMDFISRISEILESSNFELQIPSGVIDELKKIRDSNKLKIGERLSANIALKIVTDFANQGKIKVKISNLSVDDWIIKQAKKSENKGRLAVFTYDRSLKQYLKKLGVQLILLKKY